MPYKIEKINDGYKVCKKDNSKCFSKKPLSLQTAIKQLKAIGINEGQGKPKDKDLYEKIKKEIYDKNKKHSLFRSAQIVKKYKEEGGEFENEALPEMNINKWFQQKWISLNDYYHNNKIVNCGNSDTKKKFNEYPLCRPLEIAKKLKKTDIKKMIDEKNILQNKPLITENILDTKEYNIKPTKSGTGKENNFKEQLEKINLTPKKYLSLVKFVAKKRNYDDKLLKICNDGIHKLEYDGVKFGRVGYNDKIIYAWLEHNNKVPEGTMKMKYTNYRKRAKKIMEETNNKYSPASLSFYLIW
jgi:hypothetical protein